MIVMMNDDNDNSDDGGGGDDDDDNNNVNGRQRGPFIEPGLWWMTPLDSRLSTLMM